MADLPTETCKILFAATGSVAAMKVPILIKSLLEIPPGKRNYTFEVHFVATEHAKKFFDKAELPENIKVYDDVMEWELWQKRGDPVLHCDLSKMVDIMVIAPLDANTLGKISNGLCDNLLTCTARAWDMDKPLVFCPAMNVRMWTHPVTAQQIHTLKQWGFIEVPPISKRLICGDVGVGGMSEVDIILEAILKITDRRFGKRN